MLIALSIFHYVNYNIATCSYTLWITGTIKYTCENYLNDVDMCVNAQKNHSTFGLDVDNTHYTALTTVSGGVINWVDCCR